MKPILTTQDVLSPLPRLLVEPIVRAALLEDLGRAGDRPAPLTSCCAASIRLWRSAVFVSAADPVRDGSAGWRASR